MLRPVAVLFSIFYSLQALALSAGQPLPELMIQDKGELTLDAQNDIVYVPWSTKNLDTKGEVQIIQYMAARPSAEKQIRPFTDRLEEAGFPEELIHVTTVVNLDDVTFGMSSWALSELEKNKREYATSAMVADMKGHGLQLWNLTAKSSALIVLGSDGNILYLKDGKLNKKEIESTLKLIDSEIAKRQQ
ncbi:YtfJ family protein [Litorivivens sp.]|uniref:YtfJ family protein n=1 Tax=Litorivivens sp. TaxID=2020868 RepID=UPI0035658F38